MPEQEAMEKLSLAQLMAIAAGAVAGYLPCGRKKTRRSWHIIASSDILHARPLVGPNFLYKNTNLFERLQIWYCTATPWQEKSCKVIIQNSNKSYRFCLILHSPLYAKHTRSAFRPKV